MQIFFVILKSFFEAKIFLAKLLIEHSKIKNAKRMLFKVAECSHILKDVRFSDG